MVCRYFMRASTACRPTRAARAAPRLAGPAVSGSRAVWLLALGVGYGLAGAGASTSAAEQPSHTEFTADERARLAAGELVTRPLRAAPKPGLDLIGGWSWQ